MKKNAVLNALSLALCVLSFTFPVAADEPAAQSGSLRKPLEVASETEETTDWLRIHSSSTSPLVMFRTTTSSGAPDNAMLGVALNANDGVIGAAVNDMFIRANGNKSILFSVNSGSNSHLRISGSGNVIAGELQSSGQWTSPWANLHVAGSAVFGGENGSAGVPRFTIGAAHGDYGVLGYNFRPSSSTADTHYFLRCDDPSSQMYFVNGSIQFRVAPKPVSPTDTNCSNTQVQVAFSKAMVVQADGKVGIGAIPVTGAAKLLHVAGDIQVDGNINAKFQDIAEWVPATEALEPGTVVVVAPRNHVSASLDAYDTRVAGVVSPQPGLSLGEAGEGKVLVATTGRVRVRVDASNGAIREGDILVSSPIKGTAMKSEPMVLNGRKFHQPGTVVGKALESLDKGTGEILVLLSMQ